MRLSDLNKLRMPTHGHLESWEIRHIYRRLSLPFTYILYHIGFSANMVSLLMSLLSVGTAFLILKGHLLVGVLLWQVWLILDSTDGEIARLRRSTCASGWFLDLVFENLCFPINFIAIGAYYGNIQMMIAGFITAFLWLVGITIRYNYLECLSITKQTDVKLRKKDGWIMRKLRYLTYGEFKNPVGWAAIFFVVIGNLWGFLILMLLALWIRTVLQTLVLYVSLRRVR